MSTTDRPSARVAGALAVVAAIAFTASTAPSQVIDKPDANLPAVQAADLGPDARPPYDGRIEVQLASGVQDALARGGDWEALAHGLELRYDGKRPVEATVHYAVVDRSGKVIDSRTSDPVKLAGGHSKVGAAKELDSMRRAISGSGFKSVPAAAFSPGETYFADDYFLAPLPEFFPESAWDARHTVTDSENMDRVRKPAGEDSGEERKPRGPGVFDEGGDQAGIPVPNITRADERAIKPDRGGKDVFLVITVVPTDPDARGQVEVRPLIVDLD